MPLFRPSSIGEIIGEITTLHLTVITRMKFHGFLLVHLGQGIPCPCPADQDAHCLLTFFFSPVWMPSEDNSITDATSHFQYQKMFQLTLHLLLKSCWLKSQLIGMKHTVCILEKLCSSSGMAWLSALRNPTHLGKNPTLISLECTLPSSTYQGSSSQQPHGGSWSGSLPLGKGLYSQPQLNPTSPVFVPSTWTLDYLSRLVSRPQFNHSSKA